jgi:acyl carrier protein
LSRLRAHGAKPIFVGDFSVDDDQILDIVHQTAAEMMAAKNGEAVGHGLAASDEGADSLVDRYGFSSIDALECLLILEGKFGITLADEDLNEEVLSSATALAKYIAALQQTQASDSGR